MINEKKEKDLFIEEQNKVLIDLLIKSSKITTLINLLLDFNNISNKNEVLVESVDFEKIQNNIIEIIKILQSKYIGIINDLNKNNQEVNKNE